MSKDRDFKATAYYYIRRGWYDQLQDACDKKGKDNLGITTFWKAYGVGASGNISECIRQLSNFHTRPDMQYPVQLALAYFHQKSSVVDHEAISSIRNSLTVSEDVAVSSSPFQKQFLSYYESCSCFLSMLLFLFVLYPCRKKSVWC